ncbi:MAG TPA: TetR/AcrR family transcriptional regulator [Jatrophihabitans sp.]|uniref:TetR/AcrR family transcriptional regulator n=1 Tax=Jatrophihabitans sp. TaxID=1932789 RepID=UPI002F0007A8
MASGKRRLLSSEDWTEAALDALARGGVAAVAVEPLAKSLGATKGSFYWHFADRNALLQAALELWERRNTDQVLAGIDETQDGATRLRNLVQVALLSVQRDAAEGAGSIELALQASASHPLVAPALQRVTSRRIAALSGLYSALGLSQARARDHALLAYTAYLGHVQLAHATPDLLPQGRAFRTHVDRIVAALVKVDS